MDVVTQPLPIHRFRLSLRGLLAAIAVLTLVGIGSTESLREHRARCFEIASNEERLAADYDRGAKNLKNVGLDRIAAWHHHQAALFRSAGDRPWRPLPKLQPSPPRDFPLIQQELK
jgi:hypothetical protein